MSSSEAQPPRDAALDAAPGVSPAPAPPERTSELVKQFALYPLFIVIGIVAVFFLFSMLLRHPKTELDYLREVRNGSGNQRWYAALELSNVIARRESELRNNPEFVSEATAAFEDAEDEDPRVQRYLAIVLGRVGDHTTQAALEHALADDDVETRMWSAWALGKIAAPEAVPSLVGALEDRDPAVRKMSAYALGNLHDPRATQPLEARLADDVEDVRWNAAIALAQNGSGSGYGILQQMVNALYLSRLDGMTDERVKDVMLNAVKALGALQASYPSARDLLEETRKSAPFPVVQHEAQEQLARR